MEQGIIFTQDKKDIEVFFLKPQSPESVIKCSEWQEHPTEPNTWNVDNETASALIEDNKDCCEDLYLMNEQDVNENSAGGGAHGCFGGHKGHQGVQGSNATVYEAILEVKKGFENSQLNISSETAQEILAMSIERKIKGYYL